VQRTSFTRDVKFGDVNLLKGFGHVASTAEVGPELPQVVMQALAKFGNSDLINTALSAFTLHPAPGVKQCGVITDALEQRALPLLALSLPCCLYRHQIPLPRAPVPCPACVLDYDHAAPPWLFPGPPQFCLARPAALTQTIQEDTVHPGVDESGQSGTDLRKLLPLELTFKHTVVDAQTIVFEEGTDPLAAAVIGNVIGDHGQHGVT
jgi:hypothetical protein